MSFHPQAVNDRPKGPAYFFVKRADRRTCRLVSSSGAPDWLKTVTLSRGICQSRSGLVGRSFISIAQGEDSSSKFVSHKEARHMSFLELANIVWARDSKTPRMIAVTRGFPFSRTHQVFEISRDLLSTSSRAQGEGLLFAPEFSWLTAFITSLSFRFVGEQMFATTFARMFTASRSWSITS